jgi:hypothetical protein
LNAVIAVIDVPTPTQRRDAAATNNTTSRYDSATVVALVLMPRR